MRRVLVLMSVLLATAVTLPAFAQRPGDQGPAQARGMKQRLKKLRAKVLRKRVGLDEGRARKVEAVLDRHAPERGKIQQRIREGRQSLRRLLRSNSDDQKAYRHALDKLRGGHQALQQLRDREFRALKRELSPKEQAKLLQALDKVQRRLQGLRARQAKPRRGRGAAGRPPRPPHPKRPRAPRRGGGPERW